MNKFFTLVLIISIFSCSGWELDEVSTESDGEYAIPIGYGKFSVQSFFNGPFSGGEFQVDSAGKISIIYRSNSIGVNPASLIPSIPFGIPIPITDTFVEVDLPVVNGLTVTKAILSGDNITFSFSSIVQEDLTIFVSSQSLSKDGEPFAFEFPLPNTGIANSLFTEPILLNDYELNIPDQKIQLSYHAENEAGEFRPISLALFTINLLSFKEFQGNIGPTGLALPSGFVSIDLFDNWAGGEVFIKNPVIKVDIENAIGLPIAVILEKVTVTALDGDVLDLTSDLIQQPLTINYPKINEKLEPKSTTFSLNSANSNIEEIFSALPVQIDYSFTGLVNPDNLEEEFCISIDSEIAGKATVTVPLEGYANMASVSDTFLVELDEITGIEEGELSWVAINGLPAAMAVQFELLDDQDKSLGFFFDEQQEVIAAAEVNEQGVVVEESLHSSKILLSGTIIEQLNKTSRIVVLATITTFNQTQTVIFSNDQELDIRLGLKFKKAG